MTVCDNSQFDVETFIRQHARATEG
jgi:hypothetical protein